MKKAAFYFLLMGSVPVFSQTEQGRMLLGGTLGFNSTKSDKLDTANNVTNTAKDHTFALTLRGGYFLADNLAAGLLIGYTSQKNISEIPGLAPSKNTNTSTYNQTSFGVFGRFYTPPVDRRFSFFGQLDITYFGGKNVSNHTYVDNKGISTSSETHDDTRGFGALLSPGVAFFLSDLVALEATFGAFGFVSQTTESYNTSDRLSSKDKSNRLDATFSPSSLRLGISFYFGGDGSGGASSGGGKK